MGFFLDENETGMCTYIYKKLRSLVEGELRRNEIEIMDNEAKHFHLRNCTTLDILVKKTVSHVCSLGSSGPPFKAEMAGEDFPS